MPVQARSGARQKGDWGRRALAGALVLWGGWMLVWGGIADVCRDEIADSKVVQVCEPIALTDPRLVWVVLAVLLLLLPDVSELELAGVLSLKRAVAQVEGQAEVLRGEVRQTSAALSTLTQQLTVQATAAQGQSQSVVLQVPPAGQYSSFVKDVESGDTSALTVDEEVGGYASLAFTSAMTGMLSEVFGEWSNRVGLVGWVTQGNGRFRPSYLVDDSVDQLAVDVIGDALDVADPSSGTFVTELPDLVIVTAFAPAPLTSATQVRIVGALSVLIDSAEPVVVDDLDDLAAKTLAAAGAYGLLLQRVLGEPSTLEVSAAEEQA